MVFSSPRIRQNKSCLCCQRTRHGCHIFRLSHRSDATLLAEGLQRLWNGAIQPPRTYTDGAGGNLRSSRHYQPLLVLQNLHWCTPSVGDVLAKRRRGQGTRDCCSEAGLVLPLFVFVVFLCFFGLFAGFRE